MYNILLDSKKSVRSSEKKTHKKDIDKCPPFSPILSAIKTPSYN